MKTSTILVFVVLLGIYIINLSAQINHPLQGERQGILQRLKNAQLTYLEATRSNKRKSRCAMKSFVVKQMTAELVRLKETT